MRTPVPLRPKHKLGQNFLVDANVLDKIVSYINPKPEDHIVEIGAGTGALTTRLAPRVERMIAVELDADLIPVLNAISSVEVIHHDVLKLDFHKLKQDRQLRVVGNLPYYISTAIVSHMLQHRDALQDMILMFQEEVAQRIISPPSHHEYGFISVAVQYFCKIEAGFRVSQNCFVPRPQIQSRVLHFEFNPDLKLSYDEYTAFLSIAFAHRRKKLRNNLLRGLQITPERLDRAFQDLAIEETARAENSPHRRNSNH